MFSWLRWKPALGRWPVRGGADDRDGVGDDDGFLRERARRHAVLGEADQGEHLS